MNKETIDGLMEDSEALYHKKRAELSILKYDLRLAIKERMDELFQTVDPETLDTMMADAYTKMEHDIELRVLAERRALKSRSIAILDLLAIEHSNNSL